MRPGEVSAQVATTTPLNVVRVSVHIVDIIRAVLSVSTGGVLVVDAGGVLAVDTIRAVLAADSRDVSVADVRDVPANDVGNARPGRVGLTSKFGVDDVAVLADVMFDDLIAVSSVQL